MLDLDVRQMLAPLQAAQVPDLADLPPEGARALYRQIMAAHGPGPDASEVQTQVLHAPGDGGPLEVRLYRPAQAPAAVLPVVLFLHGGGYSVGDLEGYDPICRQLCVDSGAAVATVAYRLAPEHPMPAGMADAWATLLWLHGGCPALGLDPERIAVAGDSAGAAMAAVLALLARDSGGPVLRGQALLYPPAAGGHAEGPQGPFLSHQRHALGPTLTARTMQRFNAWTYGEAGRAASWREAAPLLAPDFSGLPPALMMLAGLDTLHDEGHALAAALLAAGSPVTLVDYATLPHGFLSMAGPVPAARLAQRQLGLWLAERLR
ncbi:alpha/beta hydrolase [Ideonella livida]|uniref:Alpha/beta hydrolase n=1 Tax=Ideonella livida TaxID=2707176 RepID=A0A7C9PIS9_9BURK|nr:alpha/beta hydrolase [Ideonella livida]NDY92090.1 alpha/beta hydrolase [Ideonella livida]